MGSSPTGGTRRGGELSLKLDDTIQLKRIRVRRDPRRFAVVLVGVAAIAVVVAIAFVASRTEVALAELRVRNAGVTIEHPGTDGRDATEGQALSVGDAVRTDADGRAQIELFDGSIARLDSVSELSVRELRNERDGRKISLDLHRGRVWTRVAERSSASDVFEVRAARGVVRARGTTFALDCRRNPNCYVLGISGSVEIVSSTGQRTAVQDGGCAQLRTDGSVPTCNADKLELLDAWVRENLAEDQQLTAVKTPGTTPTPSPTPSATPSGTDEPSSPAPRVDRASAPPRRSPAATNRPAPRPSITARPTRAPSPTPRPATPTPSVPVEQPPAGDT